MQLLEALNWRYAVKRMNGKRVPDEKVDRILDAARLSPSSMGLQPYSIIIIDDADFRKQLQPAAYNQPQITEGSHVLVFAAWDDVTAQHVDDYINNIAETRGVSPESLEAFRNSLMNIVNGRTPAEKSEWAARQAYIALGTAITAAAMEQVDATPMEGFNPEELDRILGLKSMGLKSAAILVLGYRDADNDFLANAKKVRRPKDEFILSVA
ncbi:MAG: NAD(P)H-dependent oxidoreductase [Bacteroidota bacterium]